MLKVLRTGKPANWGSYDPQAWAQAMEREDFAASFTAAMDCRGVLLGPAMAKQLDLAKSHALLDVAGGSGIYACSVVARHPHVRAAVAWTPEIAALSREHNDANVLVLPARFVGEQEGRDILKAWLDTPFAGGRHARRVAKIEIDEHPTTENS